VAFFSFNRKNKNRKRNESAIVATLLPTVKKKTSLMMSSKKGEEKKRRRRRRRRKRIVTLLGREEFIHEITLVSHCPIVRAVPNVFSSLSSRTLIYDYKMCAMYRSTI
jgi:hypothetical protein